MSQAATLEVQTPVLRSAPARVRWRRFPAAVLIGAGCAFLLEVGWVIAGTNHHVVLPGEIYRASQLDTATLAAVVRMDGIRTVINLRGCCPDADWYYEQTRLLHELGVTQRDVMLSSYSLPNVYEFRKLIAALEESEYPILLHCRRGADRTGLAAGIALLLRSDTDVAAGREQLSWRYGHFGLVQVASLSSVWDMYENWLAAHGETHRAELLAHWGREEYLPGHCWAEIEPLDVPVRLPYGRPTAARFRVTNRGLYPWSFRKEPKAGVHLRYAIAKPDALKDIEDGSGFFEGKLLPGESIDLTLALPALREPGRYRLVVDMYDGQMLWFKGYGSPRFERMVEVAHE
jgi:hypothetical protein